MTAGDARHSLVLAGVLALATACSRDDPRERAMLAAAQTAIAAAQTTLASGVYEDALRCPDEVGAIVGPGIGTTSTRELLFDARLVRARAVMQLRPTNEVVDELHRMLTDFPEFVSDDTIAVLAVALVKDVSVDGLGNTRPDADQIIDRAKHRHPQDEHFCNALEAALLARRGATTYPPMHDIRPVERLGYLGYMR